MNPVVEIADLTLFWLTTVLLTYVYVGYPVVMILWAKLYPRRISRRTNRS